MNSYGLKTTVSIAHTEDAFGIQNLLREASRQMYFDAGLSDEDFKERYKDVLLDSEIEKCAKNIESLLGSEKMIVAKEVGKIVGMCYVEKELTKNILHAMYVLPEYQGRGVGTELWNDVNSFFEHGKDIVLEVLTTNKKAIKFYEKLGFVVSEKALKERFTTKTGVVVSEIEMIRKVVE